KIKNFNGSFRILSEIYFLNMGQSKKNMWLSAKIAMFDVVSLKNVLSSELDRSWTPKTHEFHKKIVGL
ncbi:hypothetical protein ACJX0J_008265, partial [Zea mays]